MSDHRNERKALDAVSARLGRDPDLVQAAGGNTSVKQDGVMWIKASGTWLKHAGETDIMVPVALDPLLSALHRNDPQAEKAQAFVIGTGRVSGLRPSIETAVHAVFRQKFVLHVHCVQSIAVAVRAGAEAVLAMKLDGLHWTFVPYERPGLPLSRKIAGKLTQDTNIVILGNHGLVVAAETLGEAERLVTIVRRRLFAPARPAAAPDAAALGALAAGSDYGLPEDENIHFAATDRTSCKAAAGGSLYPDHVIFLGAGSVVARPGERASDVSARERGAGRQAPVSVLFPGIGTLMHNSANESAHAMARCLSDVTGRIPEKADIRYLSPSEERALLDWDAEKYRRALGEAGPA